LLHTGTERCVEISIAGKLRRVEPAICQSGEDAIFKTAQHDLDSVASAVARCFQDALAVTREANLRKTSRYARVETATSQTKRKTMETTSATLPIEGVMAFPDVFILSSSKAGLPIQTLPSKYDGAEMHYHDHKSSLHMCKLWRKPRVSGSMPSMNPTHPMEPAPEIPVSAFQKPCIICLQVSKSAQSIKDCSSVQNSGDPGVLLCCDSVTGASSHVLFCFYRDIWVIGVSAGTLVISRYLRFPTYILCIRCPQVFSDKERQATLKTRFC
jgi:hypothetical protein